MRILAPILLSIALLAVPTVAAEPDNPVETEECPNGLYSIVVNGDVVFDCSDQGPLVFTEPCPGGFRPVVLGQPGPCITP